LYYIQEQAFVVKGASSTPFHSFHALSLMLHSMLHKW